MLLASSHQPLSVYFCCLWQHEIPVWILKISDVQKVKRNIFTPKCWTTNNNHDNFNFNFIGLNTAGRHDLLFGGVGRGRVGGGGATKHNASKNKNNIIPYWLREYPPLLMFLLKTLPGLAHSVCLSFCILKALFCNGRTQKAWEHILCLQTVATTWYFN